MELISAGIAAGSALAGGLLGDKKNRKAQRRELAAQKEFAQHGVRWRVEDAKAAGVHPLYALGAQLPSYSPVLSESAVGPALAEAGQSVARGIQATSTKYERELQALTLAELKSRIAETDARRMLLDAEAAKARQESGAAAPFPSALDEYTALGGSFATLSGGVPGWDQGAVNPKGADVLSQSPQDSSTMAGYTPLWREYIIGEGRRIALPGGTGGDAAEVLESIGESIPMMAMVFQENVRRYGPEWGAWFRDRYLGTGDDLTIQDVLKWLGGQMTDYQNRLTVR